MLLSGSGRHVRVALDERPERDTGRREQQSEDGDHNQDPEAELLECRKAEGGVDDAVRSVACAVLAQRCARRARQVFTAGVAGTCTDAERKDSRAPRPTPLVGTNGQISSGRGAGSPLNARRPGSGQ
jgi:hypothetical protein